MTTLSNRSAALSSVQPGTSVFMPGLPCEFGRSVGQMVYAFAGWTVFVWGIRISNILDDGATGGGGPALDLAVAGGLTLLGLGTAVERWRGRPVWALSALVLVTVAVWGLRTPLILLNSDYSAAFKAVHAGLAVVSLALATAAWTSYRGGSRTAPAGGRVQ